MARLGKRVCAVGIVIAAAAWNDVARAEGKSGFEIGGRLGYGIPLGSIADESDANLKHLISGQVPVWLDIGGRIRSRFMIGGRIQYGFGLLGSSLDDSCKATASDCSTHVIRVGPEFVYHSAPFEPTDPWIGVGFGYEWFTNSSSGSGRDASVTVKGPEFLNLSLGVDFPAGSSVGIGPFVDLSFGEYDTVSSSCSGSLCTGELTASSSISKKSIHEWIVLGLRFTAVP